MKITLKQLLIGVFTLFTVTANAAITLSCNNGGDDGSVTSVITLKQWIANGGAKQVKSFSGGKSTLSLETVPLLGTFPNRIYQFSLASSTNPKTGEVRTNMMKWLAGLSAPMNRTANAAALHLIPRARLDLMPETSGLQLHDVTTTSFPFWDGITPSAMGTGHRHTIPLIISTNSLSKCWVRLTSSSTVIGSSTYPVATNSSNGQEIAFNSQYIGINPGEDGKLDSFPDPTTGQWVQAPGEEVFAAGQFPSQKEGQYKIVVRFGGSLSVNVSDNAGFNSLRNEFASNNVTIKVELLIKDGESEMVLDSYTTMAAWSGLAIELGPTEGSVRLTIVGGQKMLVYQPLTQFEIGGSWVNAHSDLIPTGRSWIEPALEEGQFFKLLQISSSSTP